MSLIDRVEQSETYINDIVGSLLGELAECEKVVNLNDLGLRLLKFLLLRRFLLQGLIRARARGCTFVKRTSCAATILEYAALVSFKKIW